MDNANTKVCTKCEEELPFDDYYTVLSSKDGLRSWCKSCCKKDAVDRRRAKRAADMWHNSLRNGEDRARKLKRPVERFSSEQMIEYWESQHIDPETSIYSGDPLGETFNLDHLVPLSHPNTPGHVPSNVVPALAGENQTKSANHWLVALADIHKKRGTVTPPELDGKLIRTQWGTSEGSNT